MYYAHINYCDKKNTEAKNTKAYLHICVVNCAAYVHKLGYNMIFSNNVCGVFYNIRKHSKRERERESKRLAWRLLVSVAFQKKNV